MQEVEESASFVLAMGVMDMLLDGGLILEGGGMRGMYTVGVLDFFMKKNLYFKDCYGVSAGASHGSSYYSMQKGRALKIVMRYLETKQYASATAMLLTGNFFDKKFHLETVPTRLVPYDYEASKENPMNFYSVVTEMETGKPVYKRIEDMKQDIDWIWASGCLPLVAKMVEIDGKHYMDGGIADAIPVKESVKQGNAKNVVVLTRHKEYRKEQEATMPLVKAAYHRYPEFIKAMEQRPERYNETLEYILREEEAGRLFVIRPKEPVTVGRLEKDKEALKKLCKQGYDDAKALYGELMQYMQEA